MPVVINGSTGITTPGMTSSAGVTLSSGSITFPNADTQAVGPLGGPGSNQTWTDVAASRALDTTYTNSTGRPISVYASITGVGGGARSSVYIVINGTNSGQSYTNDYYTASAITPGLVFIPFIVPAGSTYRITQNTGGQTITFWFELR